MRNVFFCCWLWYLWGFVFFFKVELLQQYLQTRFQNTSLHESIGRQSERKNFFRLQFCWRKKKNKTRSTSSLVVITFCVCGNFGNQKNGLEQVYGHIPASGHHCISELERPVRERSWGDTDYDTGLAVLVLWTSFTLERREISR